MEMDDLPSEFDVIVIGTGLAESVVSAAVARNGHSVLHIDPRDYYGGKWATLNWDDWASGTFAQKPSLLTTRDLNVVGTFEGMTGDQNCIVWTNDVRELEEIWYTGEERTMGEVTGQSRRFNIDIYPKVLMAREETIQLLIQSNVSRYLEFSCVKKLMSSLPAPNEAIIESIPLCRSDIFTTKTISLIEKRKLMKFIEFVLKAPNGVEGSSSVEDAAEAFQPTSSKASQPNAPDSETFEELAKMHHLTPKVKHLIQSAVRTMDDCMDSTPEGVEDGEDNFNIKFTENCRLFLQSINRYGNQTPFLWTLYGISEICQAFCRLSAIYGGIFILKRAIECISEDKEDPEHVRIKSEGSELRAKYLVLGPELKIHNGRKVKSPKCRQGITLVRGVLLVTGPRLKVESQSSNNGGNGQGQLTLYRLGDMDVMELDESSVAAPKNYRLLHVTTPYRTYEGNPSPKQIVETRLSPFVHFQNPASKPKPDVEEGMDTEEDAGRPRAEEGLAEAVVSEDELKEATPPLTKPLVLHGSYFLIDFFEDIRDEDCESPRILSTATSSSELSNHVQRARDIFYQMYPTEEFLPKAPDAPEPEEIEHEFDPEEAEYGAPVPAQDPDVDVPENPAPMMNNHVDGHGPGMNANALSLLRSRFPSCDGSGSNLSPLSSAQIRAVADVDDPIVPATTSVVDEQSIPVSASVAIMPLKPVLKRVSLADPDSPSSSKKLRWDPSLPEDAGAPKPICQRNNSEAMVWTLFKNALTQWFPAKLVGVKAQARDRFPELIKEFRPTIIKSFVQHWHEKRGLQLPPSIPPLDSTEDRNRYSEDWPEGRSEARWRRRIRCYAILVKNYPPLLQILTNAAEDMSKGDTKGNAECLLKLIKDQRYAARLLVRMKNLREKKRESMETKRKQASKKGGSRSK